MLFKILGFTWCTSKSARNKSILFAKMTLLSRFFQVFIGLGMFNFGYWFKNNGLLRIITQCQILCQKVNRWKREKKNINDRPLGVYPLWLSSNFFLFWKIVPFLFSWGRLSALSFLDYFFDGILAIESSNENYLGFFRVLLYWKFLMWIYV